MKTMFVTFSVFCALIFVSALGARGFNKKNMKVPFSVEVEASSKNMAWVKKRAEYRMAKNNFYCRGTYIAEASEKWSCEYVSDKLDRCSRKYLCKRITVKFNRKSETIRIKSEMKSLKAVKRSAYKVKMFDRPKDKIKKDVIESVTRPYNLGEPSGYRISRSELEEIRAKAKEVRSNASNLSPEKKLIRESLIID